MDRPLGGDRMSIKRRGPLPAQRFTMIPNEWVRDERLSFRARGVLAYLMSHVETWETSVAKLAASGTEGRDAIQTTINELETLGYLVREQRHGEGGRFAGVDYILPMSDTVPEPVNGKPVNGFPVDGEPATKKNNSIEDHLEEDHSSALPRRDDGALPGMPTPPVVAVAKTAATAQDLIREWIDHRRQTTGSDPTRRTIGILSKELKALLDEGQPYADVRAGLQLWDSKGLGPTMLASCVDQARAPRRTTTTATTGRIDWDAAMQRAIARERNTR